MIVIPKQPFRRSRGRFSPISFDEVPLGSWCRARVGDEPILDCHDAMRYLVSGHVLAIICDKIYVLVSYVDDPEVTGLRKGDIIELELDQICDSQCSTAMVTFALSNKLRSVIFPLVEAHREEFDRRYPAYLAEASMGFYWVARSAPGPVETDGERAYEEFCEGSDRAEQEFVTSLIKEGRS